VDQMSQMEEILRTVSENGVLFDYNILHINMATDGKEGEGYRLSNMTDVDAVSGSVLPRDEANRIITEMLSLEVRKDGASTPGRWMQQIRRPFGYVLYVVWDTHVHRKLKHY